MKKFAYVLMAVGVLIVIIAFNLDVTVGDSGIVNMNMMAQRQNVLIVGCVVFLAGIVVFVGGQRHAGSVDGVEAERKDGVPTQIASNYRGNLARFKDGRDAFLKRSFKDVSFTDFAVRLICAIAAAAVGTSLIVKFSDTLSLWMLSLPAILIFPLAMKKGLTFLARLFYAEVALCVGIPLVFIIFFEAPWSALGYLIPEFIFSLLGAALATSFKRKAVPSIH